MQVILFYEGTRYELVPGSTYMIPIRSTCMYMYIVQIDLYTRVWQSRVKSNTICQSCSRQVSLN